MMVTTYYTAFPLAAHLPVLEVFHLKSFALKRLFSPCETIDIFKMFNFPSISHFLIHFFDRCTIKMFVGVIFLKQFTFHVKVKIVVFCWWMESFKNDFAKNIKQLLSKTKRSFFKKWKKLPISNNLFLWCVCRYSSKVSNSPSLHVCSCDPGFTLHLEAEIKLISHQSPPTSCQTMEWKVLKTFGIWPETYS